MGRGQVAFSFRTWGGRRRGAGRKPSGTKAGVSHLRRPELSPRHPVHVTMKLRSGLPSLRYEPLARVVFAAFGAARARLGVRLVHFSIQSNHVHLIVEVEGQRALSRAMQGLATRLARRLNRRLGRRGSVFADRYHSRALRTPLEVRRALVYVLRNEQHHRGRRSQLCIDPLSTAAYFDGFTARAIAPPHESPVAVPNTWLLRVGWRVHGLLSTSDVPG